MFLRIDNNQGDKLVHFISFDEIRIIEVGDSVKEGCENHGKFFLVNVYLKKAKEPVYQNTKILQFHVDEAECIKVHNQITEYDDWKMKN